MLLARRERQHPAALAVGIHRFAAQPSRHLAQEFFTHGEEPDMRPAEAHGIAERLAFGRDYVGPHIPRRHQGAERHDFRDHHDEKCSLGATSRTEV